MQIEHVMCSTLTLIIRTDSARKPPKIAPKTDIGTFAVFRALFEDFSAFAIGCAVMAAETGLRALSRPTRLHEID